VKDARGASIESAEEEKKVNANANHNRFRFCRRSGELHASECKIDCELFMRCIWEFYGISNARPIRISCRSRPEPRSSGGARRFADSPVDV
jgi:hypothetical protein